MIGSATAVFGVVAGAGAAAVINTQVMNLPFFWLPVPALAAAVATVLAMVAIGLVGTFSMLGKKPAPVLRNL